MFLVLLTIADIDLNDKTTAKKEIRILSVDGTQNIEPTVDAESMKPSRKSQADDR